MNFVSILEDTIIIFVKTSPWSNQLNAKKYENYLNYNILMDDWLLLNIDP